MFELGVTLLDANIEYLIRFFDIPVRMNEKNEKHLLDLESLYLFRAYMERERPQPKNVKQP